MMRLSEKFNISYPEAVAVIFPELVRYSALRDKMEVALLKTLYVNLGDEYANFSIGPFQMKPSFAESIHRQLSITKERIIKNHFKNKEGAADMRIYRASVVDDLEDPESQFIYLIAFMKYCNRKYKSELSDEYSRVRFLASAYNCGFESGAKRILEMMDQKFYSTGLLKSEYYSYSDISVFWYNRYLQSHQ